MLDFSNRLRVLRKSKNLTQKALAEAIGMSETGVQNYELKIRKPNLDALMTLARFFDVSIDYLVGESNDPTRR